MIVSGMEYVTDTNNQLMAVFSLDVDGGEDLSELVEFLNSLEVN